MAIATITSAKMQMPKDLSPPLRPLPRLVHQIAAHLDGNGGSIESLTEDLVLPVDQRRENMAPRIRHDSTVVVDFRTITTASGKKTELPYKALVREGSLRNNCNRQVTGQGDPQIPERVDDTACG